MEISVTVDPLMSIAIFASAYYLAKIYIRENKRKNVATLKKYRIEILDKSLHKLNNFNNNIMTFARLEKFNTNSDPTSVLNKTFNYYNELISLCENQMQEQSIWATEEQYNIWERLLLLAQNFSNAHSQFVIATQQKQSAQPPIFDDFIENLNDLKEELKQELEEEISKY
jgi:hypothetical protein